MYGIVNKAIEDLVIPNKELVKHRRMTVVNCFQNCILAYNSQHTTIQSFDMLEVMSFF